MLTTRNKLLIAKCASVGLRGLQTLIDELEFQGFRLHDPLSGEPGSHMPADLRQNIAHGAGVDYLGIID